VVRPRIRGSDLRRPCRGPVPVVDGCPTLHLFEAGDGALLPRGDGRLGPSWGAVAPLGASSGAAAVSRRSPDSIWHKSILGRLAGSSTVRSRYKRQLIRLNMKKKWPTQTGMEDSRPIFFCKRFSYNENAL